MNSNRSWWIWGAAVLLIVFVIAAVTGRLIDAIGEPGSRAATGRSSPRPRRPPTPSASRSPARTRRRPGCIRRSTPSTPRPPATLRSRSDGKPVFVTHPPGGGRRQGRRLPLGHDGLRHGRQAASSRPSSRLARSRGSRSSIATGRAPRARDPISEAQVADPGAHAAGGRDVGIACRGARLLADAWSRLHLGPAGSAGQRSPGLGGGRQTGMEAIQVRLRLLRRVELGHAGDRRHVHGSPRQDERPGGRRRRAPTTPVVSSSTRSRRPRSTAASRTSSCSTRCRPAARNTSTAW